MPCIIVDLYKKVIAVVPYGRCLDNCPNGLIV